jgi:hypothetical protein
MQEAEFPPLSLEHVHVHGPAPPTGEGVPLLHKFMVGADAAGIPFEVPHAPSVALIVVHDTLALPLPHVQRHGLTPRTALALPSSHRPEAGAVTAGCPSADPQAGLGFAGGSGGEGESEDAALDGACSIWGVSAGGDDGAASGVGAGAGFGAVEDSPFKDKVLHDETAPSLFVQDHVHGPSPVTMLGDPLRHKFFSGAL